MKYLWSLTTVGFRLNAIGCIRSGQKRIVEGHLLWQTSSYLKASMTDRMHSNDIEACGKKCCLFWFHSEVNFLACFCVFRSLSFLYSVFVFFGLCHFCTVFCGKNAEPTPMVYNLYSLNIGQRTLTHPDTWSCPTFGICICLNIESALY